MLLSGIPKGRKWTWEKILEADPHNVDLQTDGYTSIVPLASNSFLIAYCDMAHVDGRGRKRKGVKVRRVACE